MNKNSKQKIEKHNQPIGNDQIKVQSHSEEIHRMLAISMLAFKKFYRIDGMQWGAAFAFNAFFSLFPLLILVVTIATIFIDRAKASQNVIAYIERYIPLSGDLQESIFSTISGVINSRGQASIIAFLLLIWVALQCFTTLISAINRANGISVQSWWLLSFKSLVLLLITAIAILIGIAMTMLRSFIEGLFVFENRIIIGLANVASYFIPIILLFLGLSLFYLYAPKRPTKLGNVWLAALTVTFLLQICQSLFVVYLINFATLNAVYGALGAAMALLLWIFLSGCIFIYGACLCAAKAELFSLKTLTRL